jgi:hypothetical protein
MTTFGWTWEYVDDEMTLPRLHAIFRQWKRFPPVHIMVANYLGYKDETPAQASGPLDGLFESMSGEM